MEKIGAQLFHTSACMSVSAYIQGAPPEFRRPHYSSLVLSDSILNGFVYRVHSGLHFSGKYLDKSFERVCRRVSFGLLKDRGMCFQGFQGAFGFFAIGSCGRMSDTVFVLEARDMQHGGSHAYWKAPGGWGGVTGR